MIMAKPKVFIVGETKINEDGLSNFLNHIGVPEWETDAISDAEKLTEVAGKNCYQSFSTELNKNLTRTGGRNNYEYIQDGIVATKHGSVLEHTTVNIIATDVSRVLTHELVRHRAGAAYSQQSGRYVRSDVMKLFIPPEIMERPEVLRKFIMLADHIQVEYDEMVKICGLDTMKDFGEKKRITSALRRIRPNGEANSIMFTYNHRTFRQVIEARTDPAAEEEIRVLFHMVYVELCQKFPAIYGDATEQEHELPYRAPAVKFKHSKI